MKKIAIITATIMLIVAAAYPVFARGGGRGWGKYIGGSFGGPCYSSRIQDLTDEQKTGLEELELDFVESTAELRNQLKTKKREMNKALSETEPDLENLKSMQENISELKAEMAQKRLDYELGARKIVPGIGEKAGNFGSGRGKGRGKGPGSGRGSGSGGPCWR